MNQYWKYTGIGVCALTGVYAYKWYNNSDKLKIDNKLNIDNKLKVDNKIDNKSKCLNCQECKDKKHILNQCPHFLPFKRSVSKESYVGELKQEDIDGYCAAGILLTSNGKVLLAKETRKDKTLFNVIGGKRDIFGESPWDCAKREFLEETAAFDICAELKPSMTYFHNISKYVLFIVRCDSVTEECAIKRTRVSKDEELEELKWFEFDKTFDDVLLFDWAQQQLKTLDDLMKEQNLKL